MSRTAWLMLVSAACSAPEAPEDRAAVAQLQPVSGQGAPATLRFEEAARGLTVTAVEGSMPEEALEVRIIDHCKSGDAVHGLADEGPTGEDAGTTAGMKGQRAESTPATADESGQASPAMRPTSATPEHRELALTPSPTGWTVDAPITLEEILGRAVTLEGPSGPMCGEVRPSTSGAPAPAG